MAGNKRQFSLQRRSRQPGLPGRRRYINIQRAERDTTPHAGSGGVEIPTIKVRGPLEQSRALSLALPLLSLSRFACACRVTWRALLLLLLLIPNG